MRRNLPARYTLPETPIPDDFKCVQVNVPNDPMHIAAFQGQIKALSSAYVWQNDDDHTALDAASAWKPVFDDLCLNPSQCGVVVPGILCISGSFADLAYRSVPGIGAPCSPSRVPGVGWESCFDSVGGHHTLDVLIPFDSQTFVRNSSLHFFRTVLAGFSWSVDFFFLGSSVYHFDDVAIGGGGVTFSDTINQQADSIVISAVALDSSTTEHIILDEWKICYTGDFPLAGSTNFTHIFDFTVSDGGFVERSSGEAIYSAGIGWLPGGLSDNNRCVIERSIPAGVQITAMTADFDWSFGSGSIGSAGHRIYTFVSSSYDTVLEYTSPGSGIHLSLSQTPRHDDLIGFNFYVCEGTGCSGGSLTCRRITVSGIGPDPF